jgi:hypothetical protein
MKYKLNVAHDVDTDEPDVFILNLPKGWRFDDQAGHRHGDYSHVRGYDSMKELRADIKYSVVPCQCKSCE